jgi:hypothetical protein
MSKRIIKLSESDIKKHIQNVISEQKVSDTTAEGLWGNSKDRLDFKIKMNQKGYSDQDVLFWTKKYETSYGKRPGDKTASTSGGSRQSTIPTQSTSNDISGSNKGQSVNFYSDPNKQLLLYTYTIDRIERVSAVSSISFNIFFKELKNEHFVYQCRNRPIVPFIKIGSNGRAVKNRSGQFYEVFSPNFSREFETNYCKVNPNGQPVPNVKFASNSTNQSKPTDTLAENKKTNNIKVKKVLRLTESELKEYISKIISENKK